MRFQAIFPSFIILSSKSYQFFSHVLTFAFKSRGTIVKDKRLLSCTAVGVHTRRLKKEPYCFGHAIRMPCRFVSRPVVPVCLSVCRKVESYPPVIPSRSLSLSQFRRDTQGNGKSASSFYELATCVPPEIFLLFHGRIDSRTSHRGHRSPLRLLPPAKEAHASG
jgi:hypothetical protein